MDVLNSQPAYFPFIYITQISTHPINIRDLPQCPIKMNRLRHRQQHVQRIRLRAIRHTFPVEPLNRSRSLIDLPRKYPKYRGFSGTVGAQQAEAFAAINVKRNTAQGHVSVSVGLVDVVHSNDVIVCVIRMVFLGVGGQAVGGGIAEGDDVEELFSGVTRLERIHDLILSIFPVTIKC